MSTRPKSFSHQERGRGDGPEQLDLLHDVDAPPGRLRDPVGRGDARPEASVGEIGMERTGMIWEGNL